MNHTLNDDELVKLLACDDREAFTRLYIRYVHNLYRYVYSICGSRETSEEIIQDVFIMIWTRRKKLYDVTCFKSYIYRCAKNQLLNHIKRNKTKAKILMFMHPEADHSCQDSDSRIIFNQYSQIAKEAVNLLPEKRRQIFELRTNEDLSLDEIAKKMRISKSVVKKQLYSGRNFVMEYLSKAGILSLLLFFIFVFATFK